MKQFSISLLAATGLWLCAVPADGQDKKLSDADIRKLLPGKWVQEKTSNGLSMKTHMIINKDGTFVGEAKIDLGNKKEPIQINVTGAWKVSDSVLELEIKNSNNPRVKAGDIDRDTILEINNTVLRTRAASKRKEPETVWMRAKN